MSTGSFGPSEISWISGEGGSGVERPNLHVLIELNQLGLDDLALQKIAVNTPESVSLVNTRGEQIGVARDFAYSTDRSGLIGIILTDREHTADDLNTELNEDKTKVLRVVMRKE